MIFFFVGSTAPPPRCVRCNDNILTLWIELSTQVVPFQPSKKQCHHSKLSESLCLVNLSWWDRCRTLAASRNMHPRNTRPGWTTLHAWLSSPMTDWSSLSVQHFLGLQCWIVCFTYLVLWQVYSWATESISSQVLLSTSLAPNICLERWVPQRLYRSPAIGTCWLHNQWILPCPREWNCLGSEKWESLFSAVQSTLWHSLKH